MIVKNRKGGYYPPEKGFPDGSLPLWEKVSAKQTGGFLPPPFAVEKPPLCKGRWHRVSDDGGIVILSR